MSTTGMAYDELAAAYAQASPEQRAAIAAQLIEGLAASVQATDLLARPISADGVTTTDLLAMHTYAARHAPRVVVGVMRHPIASIALGNAAESEATRLGST